MIAFSAPGSSGDTLRSVEASWELQDQLEAGEYFDVLTDEVQERLHAKSGASWSREDVVLLLENERRRFVQLYASQPWRDGKDDQRHSDDLVVLAAQRQVLAKLLVPPFGTPEPVNKRTPEGYIFTGWAQNSSTHALSLTALGRIESRLAAIHKEYESSLRLAEWIDRPASQNSIVKRTKFFLDRMLKEARVQRADLRRRERMNSLGRALGLDPNVVFVGLYEDKCAVLLQATSSSK